MRALYFCSERGVTPLIQPELSKLLRCAGAGSRNLHQCVFGVTTEVPGFRMREPQMTH